jgi:hypothetical protein
MNMNLRDELFASTNQRRIEPVDLKFTDSNGVVVKKSAYVRSLLASELGELHYLTTLDENEHYGQCLWVAFCLCDKVGTPVFAKTDIRLMGDLDAALIAAIYNKATEVAATLPEVEKKDVASGCGTTTPAA